MMTIKVNKMPNIFSSTLFSLYIMFLFIITIDSINVIYLMGGEVSHLLWLIKFLSIFFLLCSSLIVFDINKSIDIILKPYIYLVLIISLMTIMAYCIFWFADININEWVPEYLKKSQEGTGSRKLYFFPYFLSLILYGENEQFLFGIPVVRTAGLSIEPSVSTLLVTPAIFFIKYTTIKYKKIISLLLIIFLLLSFSVTNISILVFILLIYLVKEKKIVTLAMVAILAIVLIYLKQPYSNQRTILDKFDSSNISRITTINTHLNKLDSDSLIGYSFFAPRDLDFNIISQTSIIISFLFYVLISVFFIVILLKISKDKEYFYLFSILYIILHSIKTFTHFYFFAFPYFVMLMAVFISSAYGNNGNKGHGR